MSTLRERRLLHDQMSLQRLVRETQGRIEIEKVEGDPAGLYILAFHCRSIATVLRGEPTYTRLPRVRIQFPAQYPAEPPQAIMLSPIFHPHVWPNRTLCLGKWSPAEKLDSLVLRIASILVFDPAQFNWKSVANHEAAVWAQHHLKLFPLDDLFVPVPEVRVENPVTWREEKATHV